MTATTKLLIWLAAAALCASIWGYFALLIPEAMHAETLNQRAIAAGQWKHQRYAQSMEINHAQ